MKLILIRHGKTSASAAHVYCGSTDLALSAAGIADLQLKKKNLPYPDAAGFRIITSGMRRCETTLSLLYGALPHETVSDFREMDFGAFEMRSYAEMRSEREYLSWIEGDNEANPTPGGESGAAMPGACARCDRPRAENRARYTDYHARRPNRRHHGLSFSERKQKPLRMAAGTRARVRSRYSAEPLLFNLKSMRTKAHDFL